MFNFKINLAKKNKKESNRPVKECSKLLQALVVRTEIGYEAHLAYKEDANLVVPFTEESFDLKGRTNIFSREKGERGYDRIIRGEDYSKFFPGDATRYIPFAPNWIVNGYLVKIEGKLYFDFHDLVTLNGYNNISLMI